MATAVQLQKRRGTADAVPSDDFQTDDHAQRWKQRKRALHYGAAFASTALTALAGWRLQLLLVSLAFAVRALQ